MLFLGFSLVGEWFVTLLFGPRWAPVASVFPFIALGVLVNLMFSLQSSALFIRRRNWEVFWFHAFHITLFAGSAFVLVPRFGIYGYGFAEIAGLASYAMIYYAFRRNIGETRYAVPAVWLACLAVPLFFASHHPIAIAAILPALLWRGSLRQATDAIRATGVTTWRRPV
jgi:O-antigen/teichoic acid export membrane protein